MNGMCLACKHDAVYPGGDYCRACADERRSVQMIAQVVRLESRCKYGHPYCDGRTCPQCREE